MLSKIEKNINFGNIRSIDMYKTLSKTIKFLSVFSLLSITQWVFAGGNPSENLSQKWKMIKVEQGGKEIEPKVSRYIIDLQKKGGFTITKFSEIAHRGTWEYKGKSLILHDKVTNKDIVFPVLTLDKTHLVVTGADSPEAKSFLTPVYHKNSEHLSHKEHLLVKKWTIFESSDSSRVGAIYDFHEDRTFDYMLNGHTVPISEGKWELSKDAKTIILKMKKSEMAELEVLEFHRHELECKSRTSGVRFKMHDPYLTIKDHETLGSQVPEDSETSK